MGIRQTRARSDNKRSTTIQKKRSFVIRSQKRVRFATENRFYLRTDSPLRTESMSESVSEVLKNLMSVSESESELKNFPGSESVFESTSELMSEPMSMSVSEPSSE